MNVLYHNSQIREAEELVEQEEEEIAELEKGEANDSELEEKKKDLAALKSALLRTRYEAAQISLRINSLETIE